MALVFVFLVRFLKPTFAETPVTKEELGRQTALALVALVKSLKLIYAEYPVTKEE